MATFTTTPISKADVLESPLSPVPRETLPIRISRELYLETVYRPDRDWLDGELKERNMCETPHASVQAFLSAVLYQHRREWKVRVLSEQRVQTSDLHYRIADLCVVREATAFEAIIHTPPLLCVEILSRRDTMSDIQDRVEDYLQMGVQAVWMIDPRRRRAYQQFADQALRPAGQDLVVPETPITINVAEIFAELDWMQPPSTT